MLRLGVSLYVDSGGKLLPVASCEQASFLTSVSESSVFELIEG